MPTKFIHYSIDDTICVFKQLTIEQPYSLFDIPFFRFLKNLHNKYGLVISCYCFYKSGGFELSDCSRNYKSEFEKNSNWLRFGFHGYTGDVDYDNLSLEDCKIQYDELMENLEQIVGKKSLDMLPRIHFFHASSDFIDWMSRNSKYPLVGLLTADDNRTSYNLNPFLCEQLKVRKQRISGITYFKTNYRFERLNPRYLKRLFCNCGEAIFFTHEWVFYPNNCKLRFKSLFIKALMLFTAYYYTKKKYTPSFPMDKI